MKKNAIEGSNGAIVQYDVNYTYVGSSVFKNGKRVNTVMKVVTEPVSTLNKVLNSQKIDVSYCIVCLLRPSNA